MAVKNVTVNDVALVELLSAGRTDAPEECLAQLRKAGFVTGSGAGVRLTATGRDRAARLKGMEADLRLMTTTRAGRGCAITTAAAPGFAG